MKRRVTSYERRRDFWMPIFWRFNRAGHDTVWFGKYPKLYRSRKDAARHGAGMFLADVVKVRVRVGR